MAPSTPRRAGIPVFGAIDRLVRYITDPRIKPIEAMTQTIANVICFGVRLRAL